MGISAKHSARLGFFMLLMPFRRVAGYILLFFSPLLFVGLLIGQEKVDSVASLREHNLPGFLIVIFSPEVDSSRRTAAQGAVWNSFIAKLRKKKVVALEVINEVAINDGADRARAFELARAEQFKFTIWLSFTALSESTGKDRSATIDAERLVAKYIVFSPASNDILGQGEIEQERLPESRFQTANNEKVMRDNSGRVVNSRPAARLPDGSSTNGPGNLDIDALGRVGEAVGDRVVGLVRNRAKAKTP